jgi:2-polyprenyl-3-methyl-5-hydroxy-6-metoxy-1,4-benzoquinol methylase
MDREKLDAYAKRVFQALAGAMTSTMIYLGDRLGLYRALAEAGDADSNELSARTGLHERWVREWLYQQGAAGILEHRGGERFALSDEGAAVLAHETHPAFGAGFFSHLPQTLALAERLPEAFRSGIGFPYDALGPEGAAGIERGLAPWFRALLVPMVLPRVSGVVAALRSGIHVADVGCGAGAALIEMARAFPASEFHGYDISRHALERAERNRDAAGVANVRFHDPRQEPLPADGRFGFVTSFDCLHDMTDPAAAMAAIRRALASDGAWLVADIKARSTWQENVARNPMAAMMYGASVVTCLSSGLSEPGGLGLGTLGLDAERLRRMSREAGFTRFEILDVDHPVNAFYAVRP